MSVRRLLIASPLLAALALPAAVLAEPVVQPLPKEQAADQTTTNNGEQPQPVTDKTVTAVDVVATPLSDLNLKKDKIPDLLQVAEAQPYSLVGLGSCAKLTAAIGDLDAVLGQDIDLPQKDGDKTSLGSVAQSAVGSLIPFRGLIREISGANAHERDLQSAIMAGAVRRGFLKGIGQQRGCAYPARPAPSTLVAQKAAALQAVDDAKPAKKQAKRKVSGKSAKVDYVAKPVVQQTR